MPRTESIGNLEVMLGMNNSSLMRGLGTAKIAMAGAAVAFAAASTKMAADFEKSMTKIETLVGIAGGEVREMGKEVKELSRVSGQGPKELADALFVVTSAGARGKKAMNILERAAKASAIGLGKTESIARAVTAAMNAYGEENLNAAKATEILLATVREGNLEAESLAPVLGRVIGMAQEMKISFAEVGASIATYTRLGVSAEEATTGLRGLMSSILNPTEQAREAFAKLGTSVELMRSHIQDQGLAQAMIDLMAANEGNLDTLGELIPNVRALAAVLGTAGSQGEEYLRIANSIKGANNLVDEGFKRVSDTASQKFDVAMKNLNVAMANFGEKVLPLVNAGLEKFTQLVNIISGGSGDIIDSIVGEVGGAGIERATFLLKQLEGFKALVQSGDWKMASEDFIRLGEAIATAQKRIQEIQGAPTGPTPGGFIFADPVTQVSSKATNSGLPKVKKQVTALTGAIKGLGTVQKEVLERGIFRKTAVDNVGKVSDGIQSVGAEVTTLGQAFKGIGTGIKDFIDQLLDAGIKGIEIGAMIQSGITSAITQFGQVMGTVLATGKGFFSGLLGILGSFMSTFGQAIIAAGVASEAFKKTLLINPVLAIGAGVALVAAGALVKNLAMGGVQGMRGGGTVGSSGVFKVHKDEFVTLPAGTSVTSQRNSRGMGGGGGNLSMSLSLRNMNIQLDRERQRMAR